MSYMRVIPRDLFNEANLLKCYGRVYIELERTPGYTGDELGADHDGERFEIHQSPDDGSLSLANVHLNLPSGERVHLWRPVNSREPFPLWMRTANEDDLQVFTDEGRFTDEMKAFLENARS